MPADHSEGETLDTYVEIYSSTMSGDRSAPRARKRFWFDLGDDDEDFVVKNSKNSNRLVERQLNVGKKKTLNLIITYISTRI